MDERPGAVERIGAAVTRIAADPRLRRAASTARKLSGPIALLALMAAAWSARSVLADVFAQIAPLNLVVALALWSPVHAVPAVFDRTVLRGMGVTVQLRSLYDTYFARLPAKYLPGGVWHNVSRLSDLRNRGVSGQALTVLGALQISVPAGTALAIGGTLLALSGSPFQPAAPIAGVAVLTLVATPFVVLAASRTVEAAPVRRSVTRAVLASMTTWVFASLAFHTYLSAFSLTTGGGGVPGIAGAYLVGWGTGFLSIFTPQGLGVFEASTAALLQTDRPFELIVTVAAGFRAVPLISDVLAWATHTVARRFSR